ncbi:MAG TPA: glycosyltransferase family 4 protein [Candidatus Merdisoma merdipullorum]|nr:glycosyltransferase family 4 protein [Candidatus Merdisoma merdipullorum]
MKTLVIITNIPSPYRVDFFYYLQENTREYEIHILYASKNEDNRSWEIKKDKIVNSHFLPSWTLKIPKRYDTKYIHITKGVGAVLRELQPDIVVGSEYNPTILQAVHYCIRHRIPYVSWTDGTLHSERNISSLQKMLRRHIIGHAAAYIGSSTKSQEAQIYYGAAPERCFISFLTVDLERYKISKEERDGKRLANRLLYVGSLIERKGLDLLFRALKGIKEPYTLTIVGNGPEKDRLQCLAEELQIQDKVEFLGYLHQDELKKEYIQSGIFVLPTREDCFALVILEAMCAGLPIICSQYADGSYDLIEEGVNGCVIDPYNTENFRSCLKRMLERPDMAARMGEASEEKLEKFYFQEVSKGFMEAVRLAENCKNGQKG